MGGEIALHEPSLEKLEKQTELIHQLTEDVGNLVPLLNNLENQISQCKRCLLIVKDIMGVYDL